MAQAHVLGSGTCARRDSGRFCSNTASLVQHSELSTPIYNDKGRSKAKKPFKLSPSKYTLSVELRICTCKVPLCKVPLCKVPLCTVSRHASLRPFFRPLRGLSLLKLAHATLASWAASQWRGLAHLAHKDHPTKMF